MGLFSKAFSFLRKQKYVLDGRTVQIIDYARGYVGDKNKLVADILDVCSSYKYARKIPFIEIILMFEGDEENGEASAAYAVDKKNIKIFLDKTPKKDYSVKDNLRHEILHMWHDVVSEMAKTTIVGDKLLELYDKAKVLPNRVMISSVFSKILLEGITYFKDFHPNEKIDFSLKEHADYYKLAATYAQSLKKDFTFMNNIKNFDSQDPQDGIDELFLRIENMEPGIGFHVVYAILFTNNTVSFDDLLSLNYMQFIKLYEECMKMRGETPLISLTSGNGILDYKSLVAECVEKSAQILRSVNSKE